MLISIESRSVVNDFRFTHLLVASLEPYLGV